RDRQSRWRGRKPLCEDRTDNIAGQEEALRPTDRHYRGAARDSTGHRQRLSRCGKRLYGRPADVIVAKIFLQFLTTKTPGHYSRIQKSGARSQKRALLLK